MLQLQLLLNAGKNGSCFDLAVGKGRIIDSESDKKKKYKKEVARTTKRDGK
jgi:hypothetical protein